VKAHHDYDNDGLPLSRLRQYAEAGEEVLLGLGVEQARRWIKIRP
jgi:hypothetical protein